MSRLVALVLFLSVAGSGVWAADEITERAVPMFPKMQPTPPLTGAARGGGTAVGGAAAGGASGAAGAAGGAAQGAAGGGAGAAGAASAGGISGGAL